jgi:hypothetical protein
LAVLFFLGLDLLDVLRERELVVFFALVEREEGVDRLRDPGGEDVRVAMVTTYPEVTPVSGIT